MISVKMKLLLLLGGALSAFNLNCASSAPSKIESAPPEEIVNEVVRQEDAKNQPDPRTTDFSLINQDGEPVKVYTDLLKGRIVVMNFFFTDCKIICDAQGRHFAKLQESLGNRLENEINLISLSKDPVNDTPEKLKQWGAKFRRQKGWTLLTGDAVEIRKTFIAFTGSPPSVGEHSPSLLVGNTDKKKWIRADGFRAIDKIGELIERVK